MLLVLCYHEVGDVRMSENPFSVGRTHFASHLRVLDKHGFTSGILRELDTSTSIERNKSKENRRLVVVTFDDGHVSNYEIAGLLLDRGFRGVFFISTAHIGAGKTWMTKEHIRELSTLGMEIGSHGVSHRYLDQLDDGALKTELNVSKDTLEQITGKKVVSLSWPGGRYDKRTTRMAAEAGYRMICTSVPGYNASRGKRRYSRIERFLIKEKHTSSDVENIAANTAYAHRQKALYLVKVGIRKMIGEERYVRLWRSTWKRR